MGPVGPGRAQTRLGSPSCWSLTRAAPEASPPRPSSRALAQQASPGSSVLPGAWALFTQQVRSVQVAREGCGDALGSGRGLRGLRTARLGVCQWPSGPRISARSPGPSAAQITGCRHRHAERGYADGKTHTWALTDTRTHRQSHSQASETHVQGDTLRLTHKARPHKRGNPLRPPPTLDSLSVFLG